MIKKSILLICALLLTSLNAQEMPEPYKSIADLPFDPHGWFSNGNALERILLEKNAKTVIEVGAWLGSSTRFIASKLPEEGIIYAIDTWRGSSNEQVHMEDPRLPYLYQLFLSNVKHAGLTHKIIPIRMESMEAAKALNVQADLIYLDAAHDTNNVVQDIVYWLPHLKEGGTLCGDDWTWTSVQVAVIHCAHVFNKAVHTEGNLWWYE